MSGNRFQQQLQAAAKKCRAARDIAPAIAAAGQGQCPPAPRPVPPSVMRLAPLLDSFLADC
jgi:hypothetical protein